MPKLKTNRGAAKRFKVSKNGKVIGGAACLRHGMRKRPQKMKRQGRGPMVLSKPDARIILKNFLVNA